MESGSPAGRSASIQARRASAGRREETMGKGDYPERSTAGDFWSAEEREYLRRRLEPSPAEERKALIMGACMLAAILLILMAALVAAGGAR